MNNKIDHHPGLLYATEIADICKPLAKLNINYFSHVIVDKNGLFSGLSNNVPFTHCYLTSKFYNVDINALENPQEEYILWDAIENTGGTTKLNEAALAFGVEHTFTIIKLINNDRHYFHFASNLMGKSINQIYLNNMDLLEIFIKQFRDHLANNNTIKKAHEVKFVIDQHTKEYGMKYHHLSEGRSAFLSHLQPQTLWLNSHISKLTHRELQVLLWLHYGKNANEIASILSIAEVTVRKHIINIKEKTGCYTLFQLGELLAKVLQKEDLIQALLAL